MEEEVSPQEDEVSPQEDEVSPQEDEATLMEEGPPSVPPESEVPNEQEDVRYVKMSTMVMS